MGLRGVSFCVTGVLCVERADVFRRIQEAGGTVDKQVTGSTTFLVVGEKPGSNKLKAARRIGVPMIDEGKFWQTLPRQYRPLGAPSSSGVLTQKGISGVEEPERDDDEEAPAVPQKRRFDWG